MTLGIKASMVFCVLTLLVCMLLSAVSAPAKNKTQPVYDQTATVKFLSGHADVESTVVVGNHVASTTCDTTDSGANCFTYDGPPIEGGCQIDFQTPLKDENGIPLGVDYIHPFKDVHGDFTKWNPLIKLCTQWPEPKTPATFKFRLVTDFKTDVTVVIDRLDKSEGNPVSKHYGLCMPYDVLGKHGEVKKSVEVCYALK